MSEEKKKLPPIQPAPVKAFTVRLVDGHFVRVPKLENIAQTNATRPPTTTPARPPIAGPAREAAKAKRTLRLIDGRWVRRADLAPDALDAILPTDASAPPEAVKAKPEAKSAAPLKDSWDAAFNTGIDPADLPSER